MRVSGGWNLSWQLRAQGEATPDGRPSSAGPLTRTPALTLTGTVWTCQFTSHPVSGLCEGTSIPGESPRRQGRTYQLHTDNGPVWELIFFSSILQGNDVIQRCTTRSVQPFGISAPHWKKKSCLGPHIKYTATCNHRRSLMMF